MHTTTVDTIQQIETLKICDYLKVHSLGVTIEVVANFWKKYKKKEELAHDEPVAIPLFLSKLGELLNLSVHDIKVCQFCEIEFSKVLTAVLLMAEGNLIQKMDLLLTIISSDVMTKERFKSIISGLWIAQTSLGLPLWADSESRLYGLEIFTTRALRNQGCKDTLSRGDFLKIIETYDNSGHSQILETQTGGRVNSFKVLPEGKLAKKVYEHEHYFYTKILPQHPEFQSFAPICSADLSEGSDFVVEIENLCRDYAKPCVLDIKIGTTRASPDVDEKRRQHILKKEKGTPATQIGLRFSGMRVWHAENDSFMQYPKSWGRSIKPENFVESLSLFFGSRNKNSFINAVLPKFLKKIEELYDWALKQTALRFFGSSLLFIYDGANPDTDVRFKMVDFAHVFPIEDGTHDEGLIIGLKNLIKYFQTILESASEDSDSSSY